MISSRRIIYCSTALALAWAIVPGCSTRDTGPAGALGTAEAAITNVPADGSVACISVTATGGFSTTQSFDVTPGESTVFTLDGIPTGTVRFDGSAFPTACAAVTASSTPTWASAPVLATVVIGQTIVVTLDLNPTGGASVGVSFNPQPACRDEGLPCLSGAECCSGACGADNNCAPAGSVCGAGATMCNGACTDLSSDPKNCGACGLFCGPGDACFGGVCMCAPPFLSCAPGLCTDVSADPNNCGGCGKECLPPQTCIAGACGGICTPNGGPCTQSADCCDGQCDAPGICGGGCVPITCAEKGLDCGFWPDDCGGVLQCGTCPAGEICGGGGLPGVCSGTQCNVPGDCPPSPTACSLPVCAGGACGKVDAPPGSACADSGGVVCDGMGDCVQCLGAAECPAGLACAGGMCIGPTCTDGIQDGSETGVDCGGPVCPPCQPGNGCNIDSECVFASWCDEVVHVCVPQSPNGAPIPLDPLHASPTLNGMCTPPAGQLVCQSGVCDPADNRCGYASNDGPCTFANGPVVCRSGACSPTGVCM